MAPGLTQAILQVTKGCVICVEYNAKSKTEAKTKSLGLDAVSETIILLCSYASKRWTKTPPGYNGTIILLGRGIPYPKSNC